jgi:hypothetical protein
MGAKVFVMTHLKVQADLAEVISTIEVKDMLRSS